MIVLERVSRWYGQVMGIADMTCEIPAGLTALLGPNGAGKSTLIKLVTGQLRPTTGSLTVFGKNPFANAGVYRKLGYCPEIESGYDDITGSEFVRLMAALSGMPARSRADAVNQAITTVGMTDAAGRKIGGYSKGMRQRIKIAQAIVHDPQVLILDEPLNGLDPVGRHEISSLLLAQANAGKCVLVSSHILHEVEQMTTRILLLNHGRLLAQGDLYAIRALIDSHPHRIAINVDNPRDLAKRLLDLPSVLSVDFGRASSTTMEIETNAPDLFYESFGQIVLDSGAVVRSFGSEDNNLDAVFKYLTTSS